MSNSFGSLNQARQASPGTQAGRRPSKPRDIAALRSAAEHLNQLYFRFGGCGLVRETGMAQLRWASSLLQTNCAKELRKDLFASVARLSMRLGSISWDAHDHSAAREAFEFARRTADEVEDWHLRASIYSYLARQAAWTGEPDKGLTYAGLGLVRTDRITATEQTMLQTARARCLALLGKGGEAIAAVGAADEAFATREPNRDPPWMGYYDTAQHMGDSGHALYEVAVREKKKVKEATDRLQSAVSAHSDAYIRSRAFSRTKLAGLLLMAGDTATGLAAGHRAVAEFSAVHTARSVVYLQELAESAGRYCTGGADGDHLRRKIRQFSASSVPS